MPLAVGFVSIALLLGGGGFWAIGTRIVGAVVAQGTVRLETRQQIVEHPDGGVVGEILARDGDSVSAGDVLVRLDGTFLRSELAIVERQLAEIFARRERLKAERDGTETLTYGDSPDFLTVDADAVREQIEWQRNLFSARRTSLAQEKRILSEQTVQVEQQIDGTEAQLAALRTQLDLVATEIGDVQTLFDKGLVQVTRLTELKRDRARLQGEIGRLRSQIAEARTRISEISIGILRLTDTRREEAITRIGDLQYAEIELLERRLSLAERLGRLDVRAPVAGTIFGSTVFAVRSVVQPAEAMMYIVPGDQPLQVAARIDPVDIDQVYPGQDVSLVFTTFNRRTTPEVSGTVIRVSADAATDPATGRTYYEAILAPDELALAALDGVALLPGMPVEVFMRTEERTPLSYLTQPLTSYFKRAFREE
jgi:HlyD family secretion protein